MRCSVVAVLVLLPHGWPAPDAGRDAVLKAVVSRVGHMIEQGSNGVILIEGEPGNWPVCLCLFVLGAWHHTWNGMLDR